MHDKVRLNVGARIDKFDNIDDAVFSPRVALILKPKADQAVRVSYNKAFRSPSLINNFLDTTIVNQVNLGAINPALNGQIYTFPVSAIGNESLIDTATCTGGLPSEFSYLNLGEVKNKGFELGVDGAVNRAVNVFANYSYQALAEIESGIETIRRRQIDFRLVEVRLGLGLST
jgi:outer membrane receptor protein involved in Fe transport